MMQCLSSSLSFHPHCPAMPVNPLLSMDTNHVKLWGYGHTLQGGHLLDAAPECSQLFPPERVQPGAEAGLGDLPERHQSVDEQLLGLVVDL